VGTLSAFPQPGEDFSRWLEYCDGDNFDGMPPHLRLAEDPDPQRPVPSAGESISVVLADDHRGVRRSIRLLLDGEEGIEVVAEADDMEGVTRELSAHRPHVLVLDMGITDTDGVPTGAVAEIVRLRAQAPTTEIVAVTMNDSPAFARGALEAGAAGFILKDLADSDLPRAIRAVAFGQEYVTPRVGERLKALRRDPPGAAGKQGLRGPGLDGHPPDTPCGRVPSQSWAWGSGRTCSPPSG
jgi:DNA-binding NarL/FixJ family response regulator